MWAAVGAWHGAARHGLTIGWDCLVVVAATAMVVGGRSGWLPTVGMAALATALGGLAFGLYRHRGPLETHAVRWALTPAVAVGVAVAVVVGLGPDPAEAATCAVVAGGALVLPRLLTWPVLGLARRHGRGLRPALVVGAPGEVEPIARRLATYPEAGLRLLARHDPAEGTDSLVEIVERLVVRHHDLSVIVSDGSGAGWVLRTLAGEFGDHVDCVLVPSGAGLCGTRLRHRIGDLGVVPLFSRPSWGTDAAGRVLDLVLATTAVILLSPVLAASALAIRLFDRGPILFRQRRVGRHGEVFTVLKLRTMVPDAETRREELLAGNLNNGLLFKMDQDPRITPVGAWLRRGSLDELPQLLNVLRGEMSLVGPRPLPVTPEEFDEDAAARHRVRPGMTGLWQAHGANALPYSDMLELDLAYVVGRGVGTNLRIMAMTVPALLIRRSAC